MPQVASTLTSDVKYTLWKSNPGGVNVSLGHVLIQGGHGVAHRRANGGLDTPQGVITSVTADQLELLRKDDVFQLHMKNGFIRIIESERKVEPEKAAKDLEAKEPSAPLDDADFKEGGRAQAPEALKLSLGKGRSK